MDVRVGRLEIELAQSYHAGGALASTRQGLRGMMQYADSVRTDAAAAFRRNGFVVLRDVFDDDRVGAIRAVSDEMSAAARTILAGNADVSDHAATRRSELIVVPEASDPCLVCRYEYMAGSTPQFRRLISSALIPLISGIFGAPVVLFKDKTNEKAVGGGAFSPHQDFAAYQFFPPRFHVTALVSIDRATKENGCVQFAANYRNLTALESRTIATLYGSYPLFPFHQGGKQNGDILETASRHFNWEAVALAPSDIVLFDSFVPHYSEHNASTGPRRAMFLTFNAATEGDHYEAYYAEKRRNYHDPKFHVSTPTLRRMAADTM